MAGSVRGSSLSVSEEDRQKDDLKRSQTSGRTCDRSDSSAGSRDRPDPESSWICDVYKRTDSDLYSDNTGTSFRSTENRRTG